MLDNLRPLTQESLVHTPYEDNSLITPSAYNRRLTV
jgi:hypothetical protein